MPGTPKDWTRAAPCPGCDGANATKLMGPPSRSCGSTRGYQRTVPRFWRAPSPMSLKQILDPTVPERKREQLRAIHAGRATRPPAAPRSHRCRRRPIRRAIVATAAQGMIMLAWASGAHRTGLPPRAVRNDVEPNPECEADPAGPRAPTQPEATSPREASGGTVLMRTG
jgi:hypothetical protein